VVVCVDEKTQIQALDRTAPILPLRPGIPEKQTSDYKRNGTTSLFAALEIATGKVTDRCYAKHTNTEFLHFLKAVARAYPRVPLHVVCDNYATHRHPNVKAWLAKNPRITLHFTPTSGSWLNMVEIFFGIITRQAIRRGTFHSVKDLEEAIGEYIDGWNDRAHPFTWTKSADHIIAHSTPPHPKTTTHTRLVSVEGFANRVLILARLSVTGQANLTRCLPDPGLDHRHTCEMTFNSGVRVVHHHAMKDGGVAVDFHPHLVELVTVPGDWHPRRSGEA